MVAFALRDEGWWLRQDIIWSKPNPMPESVTDRCTKAHEYLFLLSKSERYWYDADAIKEESVTLDPRRPYGSEGSWELDGRPVEQRPNGKLRKRNDPIGGASHKERGQHSEGGVISEYTHRNRRSVWTINTDPFPEAHFATFPPALIEPCILAGCPKGGTLLDPFGGAGTTGLVADRLGRNAILIELNPEYAAMAERRIKNDAGMFAEVQS
jgi:DNA modification methylase